MSHEFAPIQGLVTKATVKDIARIFFHTASAEGRKPEGEKLQCWQNGKFGCCGRETASRSVGRTGGENFHAALPLLSCRDRDHNVFVQREDDMQGKRGNSNARCRC